MGVAAADAICALLREMPDAVIGIPTGVTPLGTYDELTRRAGAGSCALEGARAFAIDEFAGVPAATPGTNAGYYASFLPPSLQRVRVPDAGAADPRAEIERFAAELRDAGGFDLAVLGVGTNGHVAFNEPGSARDSRARVVELAPSSREAHADAFGGIARVPDHGMTLGIADLLEARALLVLASGAAKADVMRRAISATPNARVPASWLRAHSACTWIIDQAAAAQLDTA